MNAYAILVVNEQLETLRGEAAARRSFSVDQPSLLERIVATMASIKATFTTPAEPANLAL